MMKVRLSKNQKDIFFVLSLLELNGRHAPTPVSHVKKMIEKSIQKELDPSNFRKGVHLLCSRGLLDAVRERDLSLSISLSDAGRLESARIYRQRTIVERSQPCNEREVIDVLDDVLDLTELTLEQRDEFKDKFARVMDENKEIHGALLAGSDFKIAFLAAVKEYGVTCYLNIRTLRYVASEAMDEFKQKIK